MVPVSRPNRIPPIDIMTDACIYLGGIVEHFESHIQQDEKAVISSRSRKFMRWKEFVKIYTHSREGFQYGRRRTHIKARRCKKEIIEK